MKALVGPRSATAATVLEQGEFFVLRSNEVMARNGITFSITRSARDWFRQRRNGNTQEIETLML